MLSPNFFQFFFSTGVKEFLPFFFSTWVMVLEKGNLPVKRLLKKDPAPVEALQPLKIRQVLSNHSYSWFVVSVDLNLEQRQSVLVCSVCQKNKFWTWNLQEKAELYLLKSFFLTTVFVCHKSGRLLGFVKPSKNI